MFWLKRCRKYVSKKISIDSFKWILSSTIGGNREMETNDTLRHKCQI